MYMNPVIRAPEPGLQNDLSIFSPTRSRSPVKFPPEHSKSKIIMFYLDLYGAAITDFRLIIDDNFHSLEIVNQIFDQQFYWSLDLVQNALASQLRNKFVNQSSFPQKERFPTRVVREPQPDPIFWVKLGRSKVGGSKYRKGRRHENGRSTEKDRTNVYPIF